MAPFKTCKCCSVTKYKLDCNPKCSQTSFEEPDWGRKGVKRILNLSKILPLTMLNRMRTLSPSAISNVSKVRYLILPK